VTPSPHSEQMNASTEDIPGKVFSAPQCVQWALLITSVCAISDIAAWMSPTRTVRIVALHSLQTMSAWSPLICAMRHPQQSAPSDSCGMIGSPLFMSPVMNNVLAQHD
jgi:hypothetical protein